MNIPLGHKGWMARGTAKQEATSTRYKESGYAPDYPNLGYITFHDAPMSAEDRRIAGC